MHSKADSVIVSLPSETCTSEMLNNFPCMWNSPLLEVPQEIKTEFCSTHMSYQQTKLKTIHYKHWRKFGKNSARRNGEATFPRFTTSGDLVSSLRQTDFGRIIKTVSLSAPSLLHSSIIRKEVPPRVPKPSFHLNVKNLLIYLQVVCASILGPER
jgi:hypothetical protein